MQNNALDNHTIEAAGHERLATPPPVQNRSSRATTTTTATSTASTSKDVDQRMASVTLPLRPQLSARHSRPLPPPVLHTRSLPRSSPGGAVRKAPPQPPPRPASTLTARSTPIVRSPSPPRTHLQSQTLVMTRASIPASAAASPPPPPPLLSSLVIESTEAAAVMTPEEMSEAEARLISLTNPRPEPERSSNHYVDAPRPKSLPQSSASTSLARQNSLLKQASSNNPHQSLPPVINSQPQSIVAASAAAASASASATSTLKKPMPLPLSDGLPPLSSPVELPGNGNSSPGAESSIICQDCGKCRCAACRAPRKLPKKWLCGNSCLCSKNTVIDDLSCMCCVKGLFYHCGKDAEDFDEDAHPCSLKNGHALARFGCMAILVPFLPCLLCYPVLGGCAKATEAVYSKCTSSGCRCNVNNNTTTSAVNGSNALSSGLEQATITLKDKSQRLTSTASMLRPVLRSLPSEDSLSDDISKASTVTTFVESEKRLLD